MRLRIHIDTRDDAVQSVDGAVEVLRRMTAALESGNRGDWTVRDENGNRVGVMSYMAD